MERSAPSLHTRTPFSPLRLGLSCATGPGGQDHSRLATMQKHIKFSDSGTAVHTAPCSRPRPCALPRRVLVPTQSHPVGCAQQAARQSCHRQSVSAFAAAAPLQPYSPHPQQDPSPTTSPSLPLLPPKGNTELVAKVLHAHASTLSSIVVRDRKVHEIITASLDKSLATWKLSKDDDGLQPRIDVTRVQLASGPAFSMVEAQTSIEQAQSQTYSPPLYCGMASKSIYSYSPGSAALSDKVKLNGHTGWVRSLAVCGKWLFSCGCNHLRQWDASLAVPKLCNEVKLFTGDILAIAAGDKKVFTAGSDGSIRSWRIRKTGELQQLAVHEKAHEGRVTSIVLHNGLLYSAGQDGSIKAWSADDLDLAMSISGVNAHLGEKVHCLAMGPDGVLYSGGDDKCIRRWQPSTLEQVSEPLLAHGAAVRVIAAGSVDTLASGDAEGGLCIWKVPRRMKPAVAVAAQK